MCGLIVLAGSFADRAALDRLTDEMTHRGPDDRGTLFDAGPVPVALGHRRLSILDLSALGHQPMANDDGTCHIVYNGEIYNMPELRKQLEKEGCSFRSRTDTEVLLKGYEVWGEKILDRMVGMWGFVILDRKRQRLFGARDRFGIKPLYYVLGPKGAAFASEIQPLASILPARRANDLRVVEYLVWTLQDHTDETMWDGVRQIPPGRHFTYDLASGQMTVNRYWNLPPLNMGPDTRRDGDIVEEARSILKRSMTDHLLSDVPVGACLSGGLDSSIIMGLCADELARRQGARPKAFTAGSNDEYDEQRHAEAVVRHTRADWHKTFPSSKGLQEDEAIFFKRQEEPTMSGSMYAEWCVMRLAKEQGVKVVLNGQGGDETLAGYPDHFNVYAADCIRRGRLGEALSVIPPASPLRVLYALLPDRLRNRVALALRPVWRSLTDDARSRVLPSASESVMRDLCYNDLARRLSSDIERLQLTRLLHYADRNSMAFSIEARVPLLDHRWVEFAFSLSNRWRFGPGGIKTILRRAGEGFVPDSILRRRDKIGFWFPDTLWMRQMGSRIEDRLLHPRFVHRYFTREALRSMVANLRSGQNNPTRSTLVWKAYATEIWGTDVLRQAGD